MNKIKPLAQAGIFAGLHVVLLFLANTIIGLDFLLIIGLPFASSLYSIKNKPLHTLLFAIATTLICLPLDLIKTLLYIVPAIISGVCYGYMTKLRFSNLSLIYIMSFISSLLFLLSCAIINLIYQIDFIALARSFFHLSEQTFINYQSALLLLIGLCQSILTHIIIKEELNHMNIKNNNNYCPTLVWYIVSFICLVSSLVLFHINFLPIAIYLMFIYLITFIPGVFDGYNTTSKHTILIISQGIIVLFIILPLLKIMVVDSLLLVLSLVFIPYFVKSFVTFFTNLTKNVVK